MEAHSPRLHLEPKASNPLLPAILATTIVCSILTSVLVGVRLIPKHLVSKSDLDDYVLLLAWVSSLAFQFCLLAAGMNEPGQHHAQLHREARYIEFNQYGWALEILYILSIWLAKATLLSQIIRTFAHFKAGLGYWTCHVFIWLNLAFYIAVLFALVVECPTWEVEDAPPQEGRCVHLKGLFVVSSAVNVLSDLLTLMVPIWATWRLQLSSKQKASLTGLFTVGLLAFVFSICRLVYTTRLAAGDGALYVLAQVALWGVAETATILLCLCLPTVPAFIHLIRDRSSSSTSPLSSSQPSSSLTPIQRKIRKSRIFLIGNLHSSVGTGSVSPQEEADRLWLNSPYRKLGEAEGDKGARESVVRELGSKRVVGIEMASQDQLNAKSRVASMV